MTDDAVDNQSFAPDERGDSERAAAQARKDALHALVLRRRKEAVDARQSSGIEQVWREDEDQYNGYDELNRPRVAHTVPGQAAGAQTSPKAKGRSTAFLNITQPKTDAAEARVCEMLLPTDERPWDYDPTPVPDLADAIERHDQTPVTLADGTRVSAEVAARVVMDKAQTACDEHVKWTEDHLVEGRVYAEIRRVIKDGARIGTGVLKGPFPVTRTDKRWTIRAGVAELFMQERTAPTSKRVDPWDFFPDPACGENIHDGGYVVERDYLTARQLRRLAADPGYDGKAVAECLREGPRRNVRADRQDARDYPGEQQTRDTDVFECWYYYGDVPVDELRALELGGLGDELDELDAQLTHVSAIVTLVNDHIVKAALNPLDTGDFPYDVFPWEPIPGQPWGRGVSRKMAVPQRMLNAAVRAMLENAGLSAGPQLIIRRGAVTPADGKYEFTGRKLWFFEGDDTITDVRHVMQVLEVSSAQAELASIIQFAMQMADETAAMPAMLQGEQNPGQPETLGGLTMRMNNASAMLRRIAKQFDDSIIVPHLGRYYDFGMQHGPEKIKGDMQVRAKGSSTLVQRDQGAQFLVQSAAMIDREDFRIDPAKWFSEVAKANHYDPRAIQFTEDEWRQRREQSQQQPMPEDPRIVAAQERTKQVQIEQQARAQDRQAEREHDAQQAEIDRQHEAAIKAIEREIQVMEFAGRRQISLDQIKALLATKATDASVKRELFREEKALKLAVGQGI